MIVIVIVLNSQKKRIADLVGIDNVGGGVDDALICGWENTCLNLYGCPPDKVCFSLCACILEYTESCM